MQTALLIIHVIVALALIVVVLMQHGKQQGLSGAIAGGAETFFGKNKGRTVDAMLKKFTAVIATLFIILSIVLTITTVKSTTPVDDATDATAATQQMTVDESGNLVDGEGNLILDENGNPMNVNAIQDATATEGAEAAAEEAPAEEAPATEAAAE